MVSLQSYKIKRDASGARFVFLASGSIIPADLASIAAGPDRWLSEIKCKCRDCGELFPLRELNGGGQWCEECQTAGIEA
jgi:Zn finger protein HypA/HybF involved in hydrogenase expression